MCLSHLLAGDNKAAVGVYIEALDVVIVPKEEALAGLVGSPVLFAENDAHCRREIHHLMALQVEEVVCRVAYSRVPIHVLQSHARLKTDWSPQCANIIQRLLIPDQQPYVTHDNYVMNQPCPIMRRPKLHFTAQHLGFISKQSPTSLTFGGQAERFTASGSKWVGGNTALLHLG
jgi:hypothetical protein